MAATPIRVSEQFDEEGDLVYALTLRTYNRAHLNRLADVFEAELVFETDGPGEWAEQYHDPSKVV